MKRTPLLAFGLLVGACKAAPVVTVDAPVPNDAAPSSTSSLPATRSAAPSAAERKCVVDGPMVTLDDGSGKGSEYGTSNVENVRVLSDGQKTVVTWERQSDYTVGDSSLTPYAAERNAGDAFKSVQFPVMAYACAASGAIAPGTSDEPLVTWGVLNNRAFELRKKLPTPTHEPHGSGVKEKPDREIATGHQSVMTMVTSRKVAIATTMDGACSDFCACPGSPQTFGLWIHGLDSKSTKPLFSIRLATEKERGKAADAPAIALGGKGGAALYRHASALWLLWLDATGRPTGAPVRFDEGEVGAPAIALAGGDDVVVAWAKRASKAAPYQLRYARMPLNSAVPEPRTFATSGSAFAPAVVADDRVMVLAWMEGDGGKSGQVYASRIAFADGRGEPLKISGDEPNARDPELSGPVSAPVLIYPSFDKAHPGGLVRVASLKCELP